MNNLSCLPWYERLEDQNARRWWVPGIYPLYSEQGDIIPSFIMRGAYDAPVPYIVGMDELMMDEGAVMPLVGAGGVGPTPGDGACLTIPFDQYANYDQIKIYNPKAIPGRLLWQVVDNLDDRVISFGTEAEVLTFDPSTYSDCTLYMQFAIGDNLPDIDDHAAWRFIEHSTVVLLENLDETEPAQILFAELYTPAGAFVQSLALNWDIQRQAVTDYLLPLGELEYMMPVGQYYIKASDGASVWYSEVFTVVPDDLLHTFVMVEWWNNAELQMDNGSILPGFDTMAFKNRLYLKAEIAKPEYTYDEEGETRDGHFFPSKQISQKVYRFAMLAPEYLLDAMRLLPLADHIQITAEPGSDREVVYLPEQILLTPSWESEGDVASVAVEFRTDTVVKKLGLAYIR